ncbi:methylated-DNA--[protein]-cysteine S-methyltransferase [Rhodoferax sp.]|uniref:methylated-DNA--[protein]-cysteine S-methyltransferase n=1 Tax=Rhodoferax sp. TaxID=50421 RepID=UPI0027179519|nr:methylated-DNA--[protein]-cysteine S-methyltransferase [Rhodoferax sp.]MDO9145293.1 methylated-DNA--[protein]-cysteine S-methyltransferase [Rhodoferax sp.]
MNKNAAPLTATFDSPLGLIRVAASPQGVCGVWFEGQRHQPDASRWPTVEDHPLLQQATVQLTQYFAGQRRQFDLPLDLSAGTPFQQTVWQALQSLPFGTSCSYGALSAQLGRPSAVRAVSSAVGRNPVSIVVPCHRVLGANGALTGYAGGLDRKAALLKLEGAV